MNVEQGNRKTRASAKAAAGDDGVDQTRHTEKRNACLRRKRRPGRRIATSPSLVAFLFLREGDFAQ